MDELIDFIVNRRNQLGISQVELAKRAGLSSGTIASIEAGRVTRHPRFDTLTAIAKGLAVPVDTLERIAKGLPIGKDRPTETVEAGLDPAVAELAKEIQDSPRREYYLRVIRQLLELPEEK